MSKRTFKDFLVQDVQQVFTNEDEFSESVVINGEEMIVTIDNDAVNPNDTSKQLATYDVMFHVASSYFEYIPQSELMMEFNGEEYRIKSVIDNMGMLTIGLSRNDS